MEWSGGRAAAGPSFSAGTSPLLASPTYSSGWVFPVGGGPSLVSVGHTHHDYPAADIAAPAGSPVYALAQSVVLRSWAVPDPKCGIGLTLQSADGQTWTYCHLSYLEPSVVAGASLAAGAPVGLVGSTGDATGPHLHLQLDPSTRYPQEESWFASFAGTAFMRTVDGYAALPPGTGPVFAVVAQPKAPAGPTLVLFTKP